MRIGLDVENTNHMKTLKMLPWLAHRAGISDPRAKELWADAIRYATMNSGWIGTPEYWQIAVCRLLELVEKERSVRTLAAA